MKKTKNFYALKEMSKVKIIDRKSEKNIKKEREFLSYLHHPFIVNMKYSFQDFDNLYLVMDLLKGGDLRYHINKNKKFSESQTKFFISCLILGLEYIHNNNIIHRDIKPENLVCDERGYIRITDFGVAKIKKNDNSKETSGTPGYMAPEVLLGKNHSFTVDFFAIGIMGYEFMMGMRPYVGKNKREIKNAILRKQAKISQCDLPYGWSLDSMKFINECLKRKECNRLGFNKGIIELKCHSWFKDYDWEKLLNKNIDSPFIPENDENYDKKYCEALDKISQKTLERYQDYIHRDDYNIIFEGYTFICFDNNDDFNKNHNNNFVSKSSTNETNSSIYNNINSTYNKNNAFNHKNKEIKFKIKNHNNINSNHLKRIKDLIVVNDKKKSLLNVIKKNEIKKNIEKKTHINKSESMKNLINKNYSSLENSVQNLKHFNSDKDLNNKNSVKKTIFNYNNKRLNDNNSPEQNLFLPMLNISNNTGLNFWDIKKRLKLKNNKLKVRNKILSSPSDLNKISNQYNEFERQILNKFNSTKNNNSLSCKKTQFNFKSNNQNLIINN